MLATRLKRRVAIVKKTENIYIQQFERLEDRSKISKERKPSKPTCLQIIVSKTTNMFGSVADAGMYPGVRKRILGGSKTAGMCLQRPFEKFERSLEAPPSDFDPS